MKVLKTISFVALTAVILSCGNSKEPEVKEVETTKKEHINAPDTTAKFKDTKVAEVYLAYSNLQNALVNTDAQKAATEAADLMTAMANVGVGDNALMAAQNIVEADDVEVQRMAFIDVTSAVEGMLKGAFDDGMVYKLYCPMAFNNRGAYWLSSTKDIQNPYFGDKMLKCGRVDAAIE